MTTTPPNGFGCGVRAWREGCEAWLARALQRRWRGRSAFKSVSVPTEPGLWTQVKLNTQVQQYLSIYPRRDELVRKYHATDGFILRWGHLKIKNSVEQASCAK